MVVDDLGTEVFERRRAYQRCGRCQVHHAAGEFFEDTADGAAHRVAAAPGHARAKRHDTADFGSPFDEADARAAPRGGDGCTEAGGAAADDQDVCNLFAGSGHGEALVQKKPDTDFRRLRGRSSARNDSVRTRINHASAATRRRFSVQNSCPCRSSVLRILRALAPVWGSPLLREPCCC